MFSYDVNLIYDAYFMNHKVLWIYSIQTFVLILWIYFINWISFTFMWVCVFFYFISSLSLSLSRYSLLTLDLQSIYLLCLCVCVVSAILKPLTSSNQKEEIGQFDFQTSSTRVIKLPATKSNRYRMQSNRELCEHT